MEPEQLRRGKEFHRRVQADWEKTAEGGVVHPEHFVELPLLPQTAKRVRKGRLDLFVGEMGDFVSVVEIKSTDWDRIKPKNIGRLLTSHRRQVWKYVEEFVDNRHIDVCAGIIYPRTPNSDGLRKRVEDYMIEYGIPVV
jgi:hypothetical protein